MANKIQIKRGLKSSLPTLNVGEPALCTDSSEFYIGSSGGNIRLSSSNDIINNLTSGGTSKVLSAEQGKELDLKYKKNRTIIVSKDGKYTTINSAITHAQTLSPSKTSRVLIRVCNGIYNEKITLFDGVDLIGEDEKNTIITYSGTTYRTDDTIKCPYDCTIKNLTVIQNATSNTSDLQNYALHIDGNIVNYSLKIENVIINSLGEYCHHAIGIGAGNGQSISFKNCKINSDSKPSLYVHNLTGVTSGFSVLIDNCVILGCIVRDKSGNGKSALFLEDIGSGFIDEIKIQNSEIYGFGGTDIVLKKHSSYGGSRNTLFCSLKSTKYSTYSYESDSGTIIDLDRSFLVDGLSGNTKGNPLIYNTSSTTFGNKIGMKICDADNSPLVGGVAINYAGSVYCCYSGISEVIVDGNINIGDFLTTKSNTAAMKGTVGSGNCFAIALENNPSGMSFKKCLLINPR